MSDIFLSYSSKDKPKAQIIAKALEAQGCSVWWAPKIPPGRTWSEVIKEALISAKCIIVLWSHESVLSDWVMEEAEYGKKKRIIIPVLIDDVEIPFGFGRIEAANLIDWEGTLSHPDFDLLLDSISKILDRPVCGETKTGKEKPESEIELAAKPLETPKTFTNSIGMKFTLILAGEFKMGSEENDVEKPVHKVVIIKPFYLGVYPVTQREWKEVMGENPSYFEGDNRPVEQVSWNDVQAFVKKLNEKEGTNKYRLPSEAEWEYAARAGTASRYYFGDNKSEIGDYAWYADNSGSRSPKKGDFYGYDENDWRENKWYGKTHPVGQKKPNPWGLYDMHGNVWEWVQDKWHDNYDGAPYDGSAWEGNGSYRVRRGGNWHRCARGLRSAFRADYVPGNNSVGLGFRLLKDL